MQPPPRLVYWEITKRCNLRCAHCRAVPQECASPDELTLADGFRLIDALRECGRMVLVLTGGEPLLRPDVFDLAAYGAWRGLTMALATNGTLITPQVAWQIRDAGFQRTSISLDGPDAYTHDRFRRVPGAFDRAIEGLRHLKELGLSVQVNTTVTAHDRERLGEIHEMVRKLGADAWHLFLLVPVGCGLELSENAQLTPREYEAVLYWIEELRESEPIEIRATCAPHIQRIRLQRQAMHPSPSPLPQGERDGVRGTRRGCLAGTGICFISHRGEVFPCGYLPVQAGDVRQQRFGEVWEQAPVFAELRAADRLHGKCGSCDYRVVCGGCRARAFGQTGDILGEEPFCTYLPPASLSMRATGTSGAA